MLHHTRYISGGSRLHTSLRRARGHKTYGNTISSPYLSKIQRKAINSNFYLSYPFLLISKLASIEEHVRNKSRLWPVVRTYYFDRSDLSGLDELKYFQLGRKKEMLCLCLIDSLTHLSQQLTHSTCRSNFTHEKDKNSCFIHWTLIGMWTWFGGLHCCMLMLGRIACAEESETNNHASAIWCPHVCRKRQPKMNRYASQWEGRRIWRLDQALDVAKLQNWDAVRQLKWSAARVRNWDVVRQLKWSATRRQNWDVGRHLKWSAASPLVKWHEVNSERVWPAASPRTERHFWQTDMNRIEHVAAPFLFPIRLCLRTKSVVYSLLFF